MQLTEVTYAGQPPVDSYGPGFFRVMDVIHEGHLFLSAAGVEPWAGWQDVAPILARAGEFDILFAGMGPDIAPVPAAAKEALEAAGIAIEPMSSPSACRTYNILLSEGRRVAIAAVAL